MTKKENIYTPAVYRIERNKQKDFLSYMKKCGYVWINGQDIDSDDECSTYMGVSNLGYIGKISMQCYQTIKDEIQVINF